MPPSAPAWNASAWPTSSRLSATSCERPYRELRDELGLDHFEGRSYAGWTHPVVLAAVGFTFLQIERARHPDTSRPT